MSQQRRITNLNYTLVMHLSRKEIQTLAVISRFSGNIKKLLADWKEIARDAGKDWEQTLDDIFIEINAIHQEDKAFIEKVNK